MGDMADMLFDEFLLDEMQDEIMISVEEKLVSGIWPSQKGDIKIKNMTNSHIENAIAWMERNPNTYITLSGGIDFLKAEQDRRLK